LYTPCVLGAPYAVFYKITITYQKKKNCKSDKRSGVISEVFSN
jgi:hypothetical protein